MILREGISKLFLNVDYIVSVWSFLFVQGYLDQKGCASAKINSTWIVLFIYYSTGNFLFCTITIAVDELGCRNGDSPVLLSVTTVAALLAKALLILYLLFGYTASVEIDRSPLWPKHCYMLTFQHSWMVFSLLWGSELFICTGLLFIFC